MKMDDLENMKNVFSLISGINITTTNIFTVIAASIVVTFIVWAYSIVNLVSEADADKSLSSKNSNSSYAGDWSYVKLLNLGILKRVYAAAYDVNGLGLITESSLAAINTAQHAFVPVDDNVKIFQAPPGTYGVEDVRRIVPFNDDVSGNLNSSANPMSGWYPSTNVGTTNAVSGGQPIYFYPSNGSSSGSGSGSGAGAGSETTPSPTPLPGAFPLFGSGLALFWMLRRTSKS